jgi:hypothetical protein
MGCKKVRDRMVVTNEAAVALARARIAVAILRYKAKVFWLKGGHQC